MVSAPLALLAAGGTGGHMFPAEALAGALLARGWRVALVTDRRGQAFGDRLGEVAVHRIHAAGLLGRSMLARVKALVLLARGTVEARRLLRRLDPAIVVGFGGYPSVPALLAARAQGCPSVLHEQNAVLGRANRWLAKGASALALSFPETRFVPEAKRAVCRRVGNPVRAQIANLAERPYLAPRGNEPFRLLVTGGSQGARVFSTLIPDALASLPDDLRARLRVTQQCRPEDLDAVRARYEQEGIAAELAPFIQDLAGRLGAAHLMIARAGASTVAELAASGRPAILVPLPSAIDDHQSANAAWLADAGGAWLAPERESSGEGLARLVGDLMAAPDRLDQAARAAAALGLPHAAQHLADLVCDLGAVR